MCVIKFNPHIEFKAQEVLSLLPQFSDEAPETQLKILSRITRPVKDTKFKLRPM